MINDAWCHVLVSYRFMFFFLNSQKQNDTCTNSFIRGSLQENRSSDERKRSLYSVNNRVPCRSSTVTYRDSLGRGRLFLGVFVFCFCLARSRTPPPLALFGLLTAVAPHDQ